MNQGIYILDKRSRGGCFSGGLEEDVVGLRENRIGERRGRRSFVRILEFGYLGFQCCVCVAGV